MSHFSINEALLTLVNCSHTVVSSKYVRNYVAFQALAQRLPGASGPFDPSQLDLTTWNTKAVVGFLRIVLGCVVGWLFTASFVSNTS